MTNTVVDRQEVIIRRESVEDDGIIYEYMLTATENVAIYGTLYSIKLGMNFHGEESCASLSECFANREKAERFFNLLSENLATPHDLIYVFEDYISI